MLELRACAYADIGTGAWHGVAWLGLDGRLVHDSCSTPSQALLDRWDGSCCAIFRSVCCKSMPRIIIFLWCSLDMDEALAHSGWNVRTVWCSHYYVITRYISAYSSVTWCIHLDENVRNS